MRALAPIPTDSPEERFIRNSLIRCEEELIFYQSRVIKLSEERAVLYALLNKLGSTTPAQAEEEKTPNAL